MGKTITWNGIASSAVPGLIIGEILAEPIGAPRTTFVDVPGKEGAWVFPQKRGMKKMTVVDCNISTTRDLLASSIEALADWLDVEGQAYLQRSDRPDVFYEATLVTAGISREWNGLGKFDLEWSLQPYALAEAIETEAWSGDENHTHSWDPAVDMYLYPTVQVKPTNGTLTGFSIDFNGETLTYDGLINSGDTITINSISSVATAGVTGDTMLTGAYDPSASVMQYVTGVFPIIIPGGTNDVQFIRLTGTATAIDITVQYRKKYRS